MGTQGECHTKKKEKLGHCIYKPREVVSKVLEAKRKAHNRFSCKASGKANPVLGYHHLSGTLGLHRYETPPAAEVTRVTIRFCSLGGELTWSVTSGKDTKCMLPSPALSSGADHLWTSAPLPSS